MSNNAHGRRSAQINRASNGQPLGVALFLNRQELRDLDINLRRTDRIIYTVDNGEIRLAMPDREVTSK